jgi:bacteriocin biosynthesis cyclodehydratase domain-containing protein
MTELLKRAGVGFVEQFDLGDNLRRVIPERSSDLAPLLVVVLEGNEEPDILNRLDDQCAALGVRWLRAKLDVERLTAELGPYFERGETACYRCFRNGDFQARDVESRRQRARSREPDELMRRAWADIVASEAIYLLSRIGPIVTRGTVVPYDLQTWEAQRLPVCRLAGCAPCRGDDVDNHTGPAPVALAYEDAVGFPSRHLVDPKAHQIHYHAHNLELAYQSKHYRSAPQFRLPAPSTLPLPTADAIACLVDRSVEHPTHPLTVARLATLLMFAAGLRSHASSSDGKLRRWSPTGGNLGSVEAYVVVKAVDGLESGLYFYQADENTLAFLRGMEMSEAAVFIAKAAPDAGDSGALIVLTAAYHRVAQKYGPFGYRVVHLDAGVAIAQLTAVGCGMGLKLALADCRNDFIEEEFELIPTGEMVTAAIHVYGGTNA